MERTKTIAFLFLLFPSLLYGQVNRYVVFFKDKTNTPYSVSQPSQFLSARSIDRRTKQHVDVTTEDLPVDPQYVAQVKATGARTFFTSRWMNCVLAEIGADSVGKLTSLLFVSKVELVAPDHRLSAGKVAKTKNIESVAAEPASIVQLKQLGLDVMHERGFRGETITMAILDAGFSGVNSSSAFASLFQNGQIKGTFDFVGNTGNVYQYDEHGTEVFSIIGASIPNTFSGGAPGASFYLFVTEDGETEYRIEEYNWLFACEKADSVGADIISSSLGYSTFYDPEMDYKASDLDGKTAVVTQAATFALKRGMVVVCSAGNEAIRAWRYVTPPADAIGVLSCGAVDSGGTKADFSSIGPTADNRIKPDVAALGTGNTVVLPSGDLGARNGTSFACPLVASLVAGVWQAYPQLTSAQVYETIINSADNSKNPNNLVGYGIPNFLGVVNYLESTALTDDIAVYPNPVLSTTLHVRLKEPSEESLTVTIYDRLGRTLSESTIQSTWRNNPVEINVDNIKTGLYLLKVASHSHTRTFRWIKL